MRFHSSLFFYVLLGATTTVAAEPAVTPTAEQGSWQHHSLRFDYVGMTTIYSCDGLVTKLRLLLKAAGARADARVTETGCTELGGRPDRFAGARLDFHSLAPAAAGTPDAVATAWRAVQLRNSRPMELDRGDCELVEQFRDSVLAKHFATRIVHTRVLGLEPRPASANFCTTRENSICRRRGSSRPYSCSSR